MQTFKTENHRSPLSNDTIEKLVEIMMDIVNKKPKSKVIKDRRCSNYFYNKAKGMLIDMSKQQTNKVDKVTKIQSTIETQNVIQNQKIRQIRKNAIFNSKYEIIKLIDEGSTSKVFLGQDLQDSNIKVAIKILKAEFLMNTDISPPPIVQNQREIQILRSLNHPNINKIIEHGNQGILIQPSGQILDSLVYIVLDYVPNGIFFKLIESAQKMGELSARFFMEQLVDVVSYLHGQGVVHRDLKPENILVGDDLNLIVSDFGFATKYNINQLSSLKGTGTYMAPEIKERKIYDGRQTDIFSLGVILFTMVQGIFPFSLPAKDDEFYKLIIQGRIDEYWDIMDGKSLSEEFKDLVISMLSYDPALRPTIEEILRHPWMQKQLVIEPVSATTQERDFCLKVTQSNNQYEDVSTSVESPIASQYKNKCQMQNIGQLLKNRPKELFSPFDE